MTLIVTMTLRVSVLYSQAGQSRLKSIHEGVQPSLSAGKHSIYGGICLWINDMTFQHSPDITVFNSWESWRYGGSSSSFHTSEVLLLFCVVVITVVIV